MYEYSSKLYDSISCKFVKCRWIFLELHSWSPRKKEKIDLGLFFTSIPKMSHWRISSRSQAVTVKQCDACRVILLIAFLNLLPLPLWSLEFPDTHSIQLTGTVPKVLYSNKFDRGFNVKQNNAQYITSIFCLFLRAFKFFIDFFFVYPYTVTRALNNYCQTQKTMKTWKISGMLIVYWPITIKFTIHKQTSKPQPNYHCCLQFSYLAPYWLISCNTITLHKYFWWSRFCEFHSYSK